MPSSASYTLAYLGFAAPNLIVLAAHVASYPTLLAIAAFLALSTGALVARRSVPGWDARPSPARGLPGRPGR
jgi:hypothetical protein